MNPIERYLDTITRRDPAALIDIRYRTGERMGQRFYRASDRHAAASFISRRGAVTDVYVGVAPRTRKSGGKDAITHSNVVWAELDHPDSTAALDELAMPASLVIVSGTPGHAHIYWRLREPLAAVQVEQLNKRIALALDGDSRSTDIARLLRPPGTRNQKHSPPMPVEVLLDAPHAYTANQLDARLPQLPVALARPPRVDVVRVRGGTDRALRAIPAGDYVTALTGQTPNSDGKINCPFHQDRTASLHVYDHDWYCYGCGRGGSIYDFAALLLGRGTRGEDFLELRRELASIIG